MKNLLVAALVVLGLTTVSCTKSNDSLSNQSEIEARRVKNNGGSGVDNSIPQPTGLSATATSSTQVKLAWNGVTNATSYWIYRDAYVPAIVTTTNYTDAGVSPGTTYTYAIAAVVNSTLGPKSASVTVTTPR